jgi:hypothetical protein
MQDEVLFSEKQRFRQLWLWIILLCLNIYLIDRTVRELLMAEQFGGIPMGDTGLIISTIISLLVTLLIAITRLDTIIKPDGIYVRFFPFHFKFQKYPWEAIAQVFVRRYKPISEYGGWGYRLGLFGKGKAFNVYGNQGIQLVFTDGSKLLIGTNRSTEVKEALDQIDISKSEDR